MRAAGTVEHIVVEFDRPQAISRLVSRRRCRNVPGKYARRSRRMAADRTAKLWFRNIISAPGIVPLTQLPRRGETYQHEEQRFNLLQVTHLRFTIVPNKSGSGTATLTALRLIA
jgi:hypothetical protein